MLCVNQWTVGHGLVPVTHFPLGPPGVRPHPQHRAVWWWLPPTSAASIYRSQPHRTNLHYLPLVLEARASTALAARGSRSTGLLSYGRFLLHLVSLSSNTARLNQQKVEQWVTDNSSMCSAHTQPSSMTSEDSALCSQKKKKKPALYHCICLHKNTVIPLLIRITLFLFWAQERLQSFIFLVIEKIKCG